MLRRVTCIRGLRFCDVRVKRMSHSDLWTPRWREVNTPCDLGRPKLPGGPGFQGILIMEEPNSI